MKKLYFIKKINQPINNSIVLYLDEAITETDRIIGLSNRHYLNDKNGMIFIFPRKDIYNMTMENTFIPLDILFIDENGIIKTIKPSAAISKNYVNSEVPVSYAIELPYGTCEQYNIEVGDKVFQ